MKNRLFVFLLAFCMVFYSTGIIFALDEVKEVEETTKPLEEFTVVPTYGEPFLLIDTVGALSNNSINWVSNGIEYYIVSDVMNQSELIEVAKSVNTVSVLK